MKRKILFVCSSALHVKLFAPTIRLLAATQHLEPVIVALDLFYEGIHGNVASYATQLQLPATVSEAGFRRGTEWLSHVYVARKIGLPAMEHLFQQGSAKLAVFGNDTGHAERAAIQAAKNQCIPTLLVQDGFLFDQFPPGLVGTLCLKLRQLWLAVGGHRLGWVPYGMGGCEVIAANGKKWADMLSRTKPRATKSIAVIGHPALSLSDPDSMALATEHAVCFFCTNFLSAHKDRAAHQKQIDDILMLRQILIKRYGAHTRLHVKLHPADQLEDYAPLLCLPDIMVHKDVALNKLIEASWLCVTNISAVALDCLAAGRVCLMCGVSLQNRNYRQLFASLPGTKFIAWDELLTWLEQLDTTEGYQQVLATQRAQLDAWIGDTEQSSVRLLALIDELSNKVKENA
jgi:hypothetical protein